MDRQPDFRKFTILGDLDAWFEVLKNLGAAKGKTRGQLAEIAGLTYNQFARILRKQLVPLGLIKPDGGFTGDIRGRPTYTFKVTQRGRALVAAIEHVEYRFGPLVRK